MRCVGVVSHRRVLSNCPGPCTNSPNHIHKSCTRLLAPCARTKHHHSNHSGWAKIHSMRHHQHKTVQKPGTSRAFVDTPQPPAGYLYRVPSITSALAPGHMRSRIVLAITRTAASARQLRKMRLYNLLRICNLESETGPQVRHVAGFHQRLTKETAYERSRASFQVTYPRILDILSALLLPAGSDNRFIVELHASFCRCEMSENL